MARKPLNKREKTLFVISGLVIAVFLLRQLVIVPVRERQEIFDQRIKDELSKLKKNTLIVQTAKQVDEAYNALMETLGQKGSEDAERSAMLAGIQEAAKKTDVNIANVQPQKVLSKDFYKEFSVLLLIDGTWPATMEFLHRLQGDPYFFDINEVSLERNSIMTASIRSRLYLSRTRIVEHKE